MDDGNLRSAGLHSPHRVPASPRYILKAKELMRHWDDSTIGEETRKSAIREILELVGAVGRATIDGVKFWSRQAARVKAHGSEVNIGRADVCAVDNTRRVLIGEWVWCVLRFQAVDDSDQVVNPLVLHLRHLHLTLHLHLHHLHGHRGNEHLFQERCDNVGTGASAPSHIKI